MRTELLPTREVAARAGVTVSTVNNWVREGKLTPAIKMPGETGACLFDPDDVDAYLTQKKAS